MKPTVIALLQLVFAHSASALLSTNVTRIQNKDKFTNPNRTAVKACLASGKSSSFPDSCVKFDSVNTQAECWTSRDCCESCRCKVGYPTYLAHLGKCVSLSELNSDVFGHGSTGCESHLEVKSKGRGGGSDDNDDDDDDDDDGDVAGKHKDVCKGSASTWSPPVLDLLQVPSPKDLKIKFCKHKDVESCDLEQARYSGCSQWHNVTNLSHTFWGVKDKKDMLFKWSTAASSNLSGNIFVINLKCKQKKKGKPLTDFSACFIFKSDGTQIATPPPQSTTPAATTTIKMTTLKPKTTIKITTMAATTKSKITVMPSTLKSTKISTTKPSTTQKVRETTSLPVTQSTTDVTRSKPIETSERTEPTEPVEPTEPAEPTESMEPGDVGRRSLENSNDDSGGGTIVIVVSVLSALLAVTVVSVIIVCYLKNRNKSKKALSSNQFSIQFKKQITHDSASPEEHINQDKNDYQPLGDDGKQADGTKWEPPSYQGLTKKTEGTWGEGEEYMNPAMYQELTKKETTSNENMPAYHPLMKPSKSADVPAYDYGYMSTNGKDSLAATETTVKENPYYFKLEQPGQMEEAADKENPYYFKLEQPGKIEEAVGKESPNYFKLEQP